MNIRLKDILRPAMTTIGITLSATMAMASDLSPSDQAYEFYRCGAFEQFGATDADMVAKCAKLADIDFDLEAWQNANPEKADALQQKALTIFR